VQASLLRSLLVPSSTTNGGVFAVFRMRSSLAMISTSPEARSGFAFWRFTTRPVMATTNSERNSSARAWAAACLLLVEYNLRQPRAVAQIK